MSVSNENPLVTAVELGQHLSVPLKTVHRLTREGKIPFIRIGRFSRYNIDDVVRALTSPVAAP